MDEPQGGWFWLSVIALIVASANHVGSFIAHMLGFRTKRETRLKKDVADTVVKTVMEAIGSQIASEFSLIRQRLSQEQVGQDGKLALIEAKVNKNREDIDTGHRRINSLSLQIARDTPTNDDLDKVKAELKKDVTEAKDDLKGFVKGQTELVLAKLGRR